MKNTYRSKPFEIIKKLINWFFTEKGKKIANDILDRHRIISAFFESIGVDEKTASEDACRIEHVISDETFCKLKMFIDNSKEKKA